jgi:hypothetical protein
MITYLPSGYSIGSKAPSSFSISPIVECRHAIKMLPGPSYDLIVLATHLALVRLQCVSTVRRRSLARGRTVSNARPCAPSADRKHMVSHVYESQYPARPHLGTVLSVCSRVLCKPTLFHMRCHDVSDVVLRLLPENMSQALCPLDPV